MVVGYSTEIIRYVVIVVVVVNLKIQRPCHTSLRHKTALKTVVVRGLFFCIIFSFNYLFFGICILVAAVVLSKFEVFIKNKNQRQYRLLSNPI